MCGIAGIFHWAPDRQVDRTVLDRMTRAVAHRGPDDQGFFHDGPVGLGQRRLSVIDLSGGHQPMVDPETGRVIIYNGEIYNYREIRKQLQESGHRFRTNSDTEVLLKLVDVDSVEWAHVINGMFAFALWDPSRRILLVGRDRLGIKPLYYAVFDDSLLFGSEIKSLLEYPGFPREVNERVLPEYLAFRAVAGPETLHRSVLELPPGHLMRVEPGQSEPTLKRFWRESEAVQQLPVTDPSVPADRQFEQLFRQAVEYRLVSDVPVGTFNSGGVDSSLVTYFVRSLLPGELHTFSVGFEEDDHDESRWAEIVAKQLGTVHHTLRMDGRAYADGLEEAIWHHDGPLSHPHSVQILALSRLAKQYVTVVLTGEGADETFGGYPRYQIPMLSHWLGNYPSRLLGTALPVTRAFGLRRASKLLEIVATLDRSVLESARFSQIEDIRSLLTHDGMTGNRRAIMEEVFGQNLGLLEKILEYDRRTYLPPLLVRLDKMTMSAGLEARVPFLDFRLVLWSRTLPQLLKIRPWRENKILLKEYASRLFPRDMIYRRKVGFGVPLRKWFSDPRSIGRFLPLLSDKTFREWGVYSNDAVVRLVNAHTSGVRDCSDILWPLVNLEIWRRHLLDDNTREMAA